MEYPITERRIPAPGLKPTLLGLVFLGAGVFFSGAAADEMRPLARPVPADASAEDSSAGAVTPTPAIELISDLNASSTAPLLVTVSSRSIPGNVLASLRAPRQLPHIDPTSSRAPLGGPAPMARPSTEALHPRSLEAQAGELASEIPTTLHGAGALACLAVTVYHEARDQPLAGQMAVAAVVIRRAGVKGRWGSSICDVTVPVQFSYLEPDLSFGGITEMDAWKRAVALSLQALKDGPTSAPKRSAKALDPAMAEADHYHTVDVDPSWNEDMVVVARIADHIFYRDPATR